MKSLKFWVLGLLFLNTVIIEEARGSEPSQTYKVNLSKKSKKAVKEPTLLSMHNKYLTIESDIYQHLPTLRNLAKECNSVTEIGVRSMVSTWSLLLGLSENRKSTNTYVAIDIERPPEDKLALAQKLARKNNLKFNFIHDNDMNINIAPTDLLFIDSMHTYAHLTYELEKFSPQALRYIALHDTSAPWDVIDETCYHGDFSEYPEWIDRNKRGLWEAVVDFLDRHPEWVLKERYTNNHGLTIMERV